MVGGYKNGTLKHWLEQTKFCPVQIMFSVQWNLDLTNCQGTREIGSLYRGSVPYILKGRAGELVSFVIQRTSLYTGLLNQGSTVSIQ